MLFPNLYYGLQEESWSQKQVDVFFPMGSYVKDEVALEQVEDKLTYEMLLSMQAKDEERLSEDLEEVKEEEVKVNAEITMEKLSNFQYLLSTYYTVDSTTTIGPEQLNAAEMLAKDI